MKNIEILISEIIPPSDYMHREQSYRIKSLIDPLSPEDRIELEDILIELLKKNNDERIFYSLSYMNSHKSLPVMYQILETASEPFKRLIISTVIYNICRDEEMINVAIGAVNDIEDKTDDFFNIRISGTFAYLRIFKNERTDYVINKYVNNSDYLISYNAKRIITNNIGVGDF